MTNDCGELLKSLKGRSEAAQLETAVNLASVWQVHCFLIVFLSPPWLHWTICRKNCRCESSAKIMIALGSHSIQSCSGAVLGSELNERSHSVKSWENGWVPAKWEIAAGQYFFPPLFSLLNVKLWALKQNRAGRWEVIWRIQSTWTIVQLNSDKISFFLLSSRKLWASYMNPCFSLHFPLAWLNQWP